MKATRKTKSVAERLARRLLATDSGCLEWTRRLDSHGYGVIAIDSKPVPAHRVAWELANGPIPKGLFVCHHCDNPPCCNVDHLFTGTAADNNADKVAKGRQRNGSEGRATCRQGHPYDEMNTYVRASGIRGCRACARDRRARYRALGLGKKAPSRGVV